MTKRIAKRLRQLLNGQEIRVAINNEELANLKFKK